MRKYFDNILFYLQTSGGGSVHWGELMSRFNKDDDTSFIEPNAETSNIIRKSINLKKSTKEFSIPVGILRYLPLTVNIDEPAIFHSSYYRFSNQKEITNFITVHDFIYEKFGNGISKFVHHHQKRLAIKKSEGLICVSQSTKNDLCDFFPDLVKNKEIRVIYNGVSDDFFVVQHDTIKNNKLLDFKKHKYILYVGHRTSYKNFDFAVSVVESLPADYKMAIVGNMLSDVEREYLENKLLARYQFFGNVNNQMLNELYNLSECLIYPSSYEGFGIPIIEAFKCQCPVIAQDIQVVEEVALGAALLSKGLDIKKFKENILMLSKDNNRKHFTELGFERSKDFSWDKCFNETKDFYNTIK